MAQLTVTEAQNGKTLAMMVGETLSLQLPENPTSGHAWTFARLDETRLQLLESTFRAEGSGVGTGGIERWTLRAVSPGETRIELKRWRPWEGERSVVERFWVDITIMAG